MPPTTNLSRRRRSSWNFFGNGISEQIVLDTADALVATGLRDLGYEYVNIDAGSMNHTRGPDGRLQEDRKKFPRGMRHVADSLHARGLKLGVYTDLSDRSCEQLLPHFSLGCGNTARALVRAGGDLTYQTGVAPSYKMDSLGF